eukprot:jgi/Chrzof1/13251/Cz07g26050.t1
MPMQCMHGDAECAGNKHQLCVAKYTPLSKNYNWFFKFLLCEWDQAADIGTEQLASSCLDKLKVPAAVQQHMQDCMKGPEGTQLLKASIAETKKRQVQKSCTVYIDGRKRCIYDGGRWYDCEGGSEIKDFEHSICQAYKAKTGTLPNECAELQ